MRSRDHLSYGITQRYLSPGRGDSPDFTLAFTSTHFTVPRKVEGWVDLGSRHCSKSAQPVPKAVFRSLGVSRKRCEIRPYTEVEQQTIPRLSNGATSGDLEWPHPSFMVTYSSQANISQTVHATAGNMTSQRFLSHSWGSLLFLWRYWLIIQFDSIHVANLQLVITELNRT